MYEVTENHYYECKMFRGWQIRILHPQVDEVRIGRGLSRVILPWHQLHMENVQTKSIEYRLEEGMHCSL